jgi:hypothetical protein
MLMYEDAAEFVERLHRRTQLYKLYGHPTQNCTIKLYGHPTQNCAYFIAVLPTC